MVTEDSLISKYPRRSPQSYFFQYFKQVGIIFWVFLLVIIPLEIYYFNISPKKLTELNSSEITLYLGVLLFLPPLVSWFGVQYYMAQKIPYIVNFDETDQAKIVEIMVILRELIEKHSFQKLDKEELYYNEKTDGYIAFQESVPNIFVIAPRWFLYDLFDTLGVSRSKRPELRLIIKETTTLRKSLFLGLLQDK